MVAPLLAALAAGVHALLSQPGALTAVGVAVALVALTGAALSLDLAASAVALLDAAPLAARLTRSRRRLHVAVYGSSADDEDDDGGGGGGGGAAAGAARAACCSRLASWRRPWSAASPAPPSPPPLLRQAAFSAGVRAGQVRNLLCAPCARWRRKYQSPATCPLPAWAEVADLYRAVFGYRTAGTYVAVGCYDGEAFSFTSGLADVGWAGAEVTAVRAWAEAARLRHAGSAGVAVHHAHIGTPATGGRAVAVAALPPHAAAGAAAAAAALLLDCNGARAPGVSASAAGAPAAAGAAEPASATTTTSHGRAVSRCDDGDGDGGGADAAQPTLTRPPAAAAVGDSAGSGVSSAALVHTEAAPSLTLDAFLAGHMLAAPYGHNCGGGDVGSGGVTTMANGLQHHARRHLDLLVVGVEADAGAVLAGGGFTPALWRPALVVAAAGSLAGPVDRLDALLCGGGDCGGASAAAAGGGSSGNGSAAAAAAVTVADGVPPAPLPPVRYRLLYRDPWASAWLRDDVVPVGAGVAAGGAGGGWRC